jgi:hypothetical protein
MSNAQPNEVRKYLAEIGAVGGSKSTRAKRRASEKSLAAARIKRWAKVKGACVSIKGGAK